MHGARAVWSVWCGEQGPVVWAGVTFERGGKNWFLLSAGRGLALTRPTRDIPSNLIRPQSELSSYTLTQVGSVHGQKRKNLHFALPSDSADELSSGWALFGACALPMSLVSASPRCHPAILVQPSAFRSDAVAEPTRTDPRADPRRHQPCAVLDTWRK